ncbi:hypothetical protein D9613_012676 [Agrocybe pediades]|uniref:Uncharacterized protein n=1 Tax=Agrocybe pediades TaxID=84607 RepID=A0A8H4QVN6_9AGAR|nr:hypothetical protein D9613_012676 [Agrocybe pediades]
MSTKDDFPYSVAQQKALLDADLNSTLLYQFLFGVYSGVFPAAIYIYVHKENRTRTRDRIIIGSITALYCTMALNMLSNWIYSNILFCKKGATRVEMFVESATQDVPIGIAILDDIPLYLGFALADGLLVSARGMEMLSSLWALLSEIFTSDFAAHSGGSVTVYRCLLDTKPNFESLQTNAIFDRLSAAALVAAAVTSLVSTAVICLQIWRHTRLISRSRKHYQTIINALVESSAAYTVAVLFLAILDFFPSENTQSSFDVLLISNFVEPATQIISGLAPTVMIARLIVSSLKDDTVVSSASLPSELVGHATHVNITALGDDVEMQQRASVGTGKDDSEIVMVLIRTECQPEGLRVEDGQETIV